MERGLSSCDCVDAWTRLKYSELLYSSITDTKKQFLRRVTTSLKLLPRKKKTKNKFLGYAKWLSIFLFKPNHS